MLNFTEFRAIYKEKERNSHMSKKSVEKDHRIFNALKDDIHGILRKASVSEENKPIVFAGCLLALRNAKFRTSYHKTSAEDLPAQIILATQKVLRAQHLFSNEQGLTQATLPFNVISSHKQLNSRGIQQVTPLQKLLELIDKKLLQEHGEKDIIAEFYTEFLRWSGGDGSGLGIVLTPKHITQLFALLAVQLISRQGVAPIVIDTSFGGASFLKASSELGAQVSGIELNPKMYLLGITSLVLENAKIATLVEGNCFDEISMQKIRNSNAPPNIALINPPYALRKNGGHSEIEFIENACDLVVPGGYVFALVPISTGASVDKHSVQIKKRLLDKHSLYAVMSMPTNLFTSKAGTMVQILVFKTGKPHSSTTKTWFADWSDDGFVLQKHIGREDYHNSWAGIKASWVKAFAKRKTVKGVSVLKTVGVADAWVTEAHLPQGMQNLSANRFATKVTKLASYEYERNQKPTVEPNDLLSQQYDWVDFPVPKLFKPAKGDYSVRGTERVAGDIPLVSASAENNGISAYVAHNKHATLFPAFSLTIAQNGSVGSTFLQLESFYASSDVAILNWREDVFKNDIDKRNVLLFMATILEETTRGRFHYGFKLNNQRLNNLILSLPSKQGKVALSQIIEFMGNLISNCRKIQFR